MEAAPPMTHRSLDGQRPLGRRPRTDGAAFGPALTAARLRTRTSMTALARRAGIDHGYVSRLESGHRLPTRAAVEELAKGLLLSGPERDALLVAGGLAPVDPLYRLAGEPVLADLLALLEDEARSCEVRDAVRAAVR